MDPNATLRILLESIEEENRDLAMQVLEDLLDWLEHGGFMPRLHRTGCCGAYEVEDGYPVVNAGHIG